MAIHLRFLRLLEIVIDLLRICCNFVREIVDKCIVFVLNSGIQFLQCLLLGTFHVSREVADAFIYLLLNSLGL